MITISHFLLSGLAMIAYAATFAQIIGGQMWISTASAADQTVHRPTIAATTDFLRLGKSAHFIVDQASRDKEVTWQYSLDDGISFWTLISGPDLEIDRTEPWMHLIQIRVATTIPGSTVHSDPVVLILETTPRDGDLI